MNSGNLLGEGNIYISGDYPSELAHVLLEEKPEVRVTQEYRSLNSTERERHGYMSGGEASEWLREFGLEDMLSREAIESGVDILGWNPLRPEGMSSGPESYFLHQEDGNGELVVEAYDRAPWPIKQSEKLRFNW